MTDDLMDTVMLYGDRDPYEQDKAGGYFSRHMHHLTTENLHSKAEIAEELAHRDIEIARLSTESREKDEVVAQRNREIGRLNRRLERYESPGIACECGAHKPDECVCDAVSGRPND